MPTYVWLIIFAALVLVWWLWSKYGGIYTAINNNPTAVGAGLAINHYATDIVGLVNAYQAQDQDGGSFFSRMGAFVGALPKS
jgi:hypothetical protein